MRYVIAGAGAAGITAAETIRSLDPKGEILIFSNEPYGFYSRPGLAYYLTGEIPESQLYPMEIDFFKKLNFKMFQSGITALYPDRHLIQIDQGNQIHFDRLLIATGSTAVQPELPGNNLEGVVKLDNMDDAREILKRIRKTKQAVVVGGGITALEIVEGFLARRIKTHFFLRKDRYWGNVLDETESNIILTRLKHEGVHLHFHTELAEISGKKGRVNSVQTKNQETIPCQMVAIAIGVRPNISFAIKAGLKTERGLIVDNFMRTSEPDIYAAGDVAQVIDPLSGKSTMDVLWGIAREQARVAAWNMVGKQTPYERSTPMNVTRLAGLTTTIIGMVGNGRGNDPDLLEITRGDSETWREIPDAIIAQEDFDVNRIRLLVGNENILGAVVIGDQTLSQPIQRLITEQVNIGPIKDQLTQPEADLAGILANFWAERRSRRAEK
jgi:NAD(P)H-nitrite reductase large subunit